MWKTKSKAENLIEDLEKKVYQKEAISLPKLKSYLFQQNEDCWEEFEELLRDSRKSHTKKRRIPLTLKELRKWKKEWQSKMFGVSPNEKKVGQADTNGTKDKNESLGKVKKLIQELKERVAKGKMIYKGDLKRDLFQESEKFREEFGEQLKINRKKAGKLRIPLTLEEFQEWKKEWEKLEVSPASNFNFEEKVEERVKKEAEKKSEPNLPILPNEKSHGPFIYDLRDNKLWYQNQPLHWESRSQMGGDWFGNNQIKIYIQRLDNWNISVHAKIGLLTYKSYFSCFKTEKIVLFFCPWNQVYRNGEGKWEKKEDLETAQKFLAKYDLKLPDRTEKSKKLEELKKLVDQLTPQELWLVREKLGKK